MASTGLVVAVCLVRKQLKENQRIVTAERRQIQAQRFAEVLYDAANRLSDFADEVQEESWPIPPDGGYTKLLRMMDPVTRAAMRAHGTIGSSNAVADVSKFEQSLRNRFQRAAIEHSVGARVQGFTEGEIHIALAHLLRHYVEYFNLTGENLEDWDGASDPPVSAARRPQFGVDLPTEYGTVSMVPHPPLMLSETDAEADAAMFREYLRAVSKAQSPTLKPPHPPTSTQG
ncbi:hypothetical protein LRS71_09445 [Rhodococcus pyridinivorans]|uniref:hypothetical protein n=1 Tax=Rhodococcus pyridinivorans TaxID=103816 RepID=UPI001E58356D|nr:hypothetical protein [Rhodococcus pyridinivorans]MCD5419777.1 hypothetical protein [Rhodococcus pyridinivorans]